MNAAWVIVQPLRSQDSYDSGLNQVSQGNTAAALTDARDAGTSNPLAVEPLWLQAAIYTGAGNYAAAHGSLVKATSVQPSNPQTWARLGCYDVLRAHDRLAADELRHAATLLPGVTAIRSQPSQYCETINA